MKKKREKRVETGVESGRRQANFCWSMGLSGREGGEGSTLCLEYRTNNGDRTDKTIMNYGVA